MIKIWSAGRVCGQCRVRIYIREKKPCCVHVHQRRSNTNTSQQLVLCCVFVAKVSSSSSCFICSDTDFLDLYKHIFSAACGIKEEKKTSSGFFSRFDQEKKKVPGWMRESCGSRLCAGSWSDYGGDVCDWDQWMWCSALITVISAVTWHRRLQQASEWMTAPSITCQTPTLMAL